MQVIEVGVGHEHDIDGGQVVQLQSGLAQALENEEPSGEVGVDHNVHPTHLQKKAGMPDEGNAQFAIRDQKRLVGLARAGSDRGMPYQTGKLTCAFA